MRRAALCEVFPVPDPALVAKGMAIQASLPATEHSSRERAEAATGAAVCQSCHRRINAFGFVLENFGPLGEWRTSQNVVDDTGKTIASFKIDSHVDDIQVDSVGSLDDASRLAPSLATTKAAAGCFAERLFISSRWRYPSAEDDCLLRELVDATDDVSVAEALVSSIANDDIFYRAEAAQ